MTRRMAWGFRLHIAKPLNGQDLIERASVVLESAVVPIKDASAVQRRLQISVEDYIDSLQGLEEQAPKPGIAIYLWREE